jgi:hypothetical protein
VLVTVAGGGAGDGRDRLDVPTTYASSATAMTAAATDVR